MEGSSSQGVPQHPIRTPWKEYAGAPAESRGPVGLNAQTKLRQEHAAAMEVKKALQKVKTSNLENRNQLIEELELTHAMKLEEMGGQAEKVSMEVDKVLGEIMSGFGQDGQHERKKRGVTWLYGNQDGDNLDVGQQSAMGQEAAHQLAVRRQKAREHAAAYEVRKVIQRVRAGSWEDRDALVEELIRAQSEHMFDMGAQAELVGLEVDKALAEVHTQLQQEPETIAPAVAQVSPKGAGRAAHSVGWKGQPQQQWQQQQQRGAKSGWYAAQAQVKGGLQTQQGAGDFPTWPEEAHPAWKMLKGGTPKGGRPNRPQSGKPHAELQNAARPETAGIRLAELKRKRDEDTNLRKEHASALIVRKAIQKVKDATAENRDQLIEELEIIHAEHVEAMGSQAEKIAAEVDKAMAALYARHF